MGAMRDENMRLWDQLLSERKRTEKIVGVLGRLWDVVGTRIPGSCTYPLSRVVIVLGTYSWCSVPQFPSELLENESPGIFVTSPPVPVSSRYPPPLSMNISNPSLHTMHSISSPNSSPTASDFPPPHHQHQHQHHGPHPHSLSRQHSFQQQAQHAAYRGETPYGHNDSTASTPLPASPGSGTMDLFDEAEPSGRISTKRQRMSDDNGTDGLAPMSALSSPGTTSGPGLGNITQAQGKNITQAQGKKFSRARSDSAPLGYGFGGLTTWQGGPAGRPRSGSGLGLAGRGAPNIGIGGGSMTRSNGTPLLSISTVPSNAPNR